MDLEVKEMLEKGAFSKVSHQEGEFLSQIFLVGKKDGGESPVINLNIFNKFVPYQHFKMEGLHCVNIHYRGETSCAKSILKMHISVCH